MLEPAGVKGAGPAARSQESRFEVSMASGTRTSDPGGGEAGPSATFVVGIGASAGGLEALEKLLSQVPAGGGLAFVVVQHLNPSHPTLLVELLARHTRLLVAHAQDGARPEPGHVYVIAPRTLLTLERGLLRVAPSDEPAAAAPIDTFLRSLAEDRGERAIGVLLSGSGHDGTVGLRAIKERGGLTMAQSPETARHDSMPESAIEAGLVDHILRVEEMPARLLEHAGYLSSHAAPSAEALDAELASALGAVCALLLERTGHDFSRYKEGTLLRRIRRRLQLRHVGSADEYLKLLQADDGEAEALLKDLLIGVTHFFRDPEAFQALAQQVLPRMIQGKPADVPIRIWVPGCASGEEAYTIALLVREYLERLGARRLVQIFATDLDAQMLAEARRGSYAPEIAEHVSPERLARFFVREGSAYHAAKELREMCIFSQHSLVRDPPFSHLDLVSCRNVLIYLGAELQRKLVPLFHYALRPGGFLLLGPSEGIAGGAELFETADKRHRIFQRKEPVTRPMVEFPLAGRDPFRARSSVAFHAAAEHLAAATPQEKIAAAFERTLREEYTFPSAIVDERGDALFIAGPIGRYLQLPAGPAAAPNLLEAFPGNLRLALRSALRAAGERRHRVVREDVPVEIDDTARRVRLIVRPAPGVGPDAGLYLVVLQEGAPASGAEPAEAAALEAEQPVLEQLETELRATRAELKSTVEELESANEELKSSNEELISTNEELQSANEEMQASKEELQSLNEELETINAELHHKLDELATANSDLRNLFASTEIATIFLDGELRVARFTPAATELLHLIESDVGRPIGDLAPRFDGQDLVGSAREVLATLKPLERQVRGAAGTSWFILRILPYRTVENVIAGVVITFLDVTELKHAEEALRLSEEHFRLLVDGVKDHAIFMLAPDGAIVSWNAGAERLKGYRAEEIVGQHFSRFYSEEDVRAGKPRRELAAAAAEGRLEDEGWRVRKDGSRFWANVVITALRDPAGRLRGFAKVTRDFTERRRHEEALQQSQELLRAVSETVPDPIFVKDVASRMLLANPATLQMIGRPAGEVLGNSDREFYEDPSVGEAILANDRRIMESGVAEVVEERVQTPAGYRVFLSTKVPRRDADGRVVGLMGIARDITERKAIEARLAYLASFPEKNPNPIVEADVDGRVTYANSAALRLFPDIVETGGAHPWLSGWETLARRIREGSAAADVRVLSVGDRRYHQVLVHAPGEGVVRAYGIDITERERAEEALRESEERLRRSQEIAHLGSWELDLEKNHLSWSDEVYRIFGLAPQQFDATYEAFLDAVHPDDRAAVDAAYSGSVREGKDRYEIEHRVVRRSTGEIRIVHEKCEHVRDASGRVVRSVGMVHDVSERKRVEDALERSRQGLSRLADASLRVITHTDLEGMLQAVSEAALALTGARFATCGHGYVNGQFLVGGDARAPGAPACPPGKMFLMEKGGVHMDLVEGADAIRLSDGELRAHARWWGLPDGHIPMRGFLGTRMTSPDGRTSGMILVTDKEQGDFTADDESLLRQLATMASLALQHVAARIALEEADRGKNQFLAMLSHELRNPLAPIRNSLHLLDRAAPGGEQARRAQTVIDRQVGHLTRLVDDLLDVTRVSRGKIQLQRERIDLGDVVRRAVEDHRSTFARSGLELRWTVPEHPLWIDGDRTRIAQVIGNLLQNSAKFTEPGGVATMSVESNACVGQVILRVSDTGVGIAPGVLPRVFEAFSQADTTLARSKGGLGLGLALVKGLVEMHAGTVSVESRGLGQGAEFTVRLPLVSAAGAPEDPPARGVVDGRSRRVLVVEDNPDAAESLREVIELAGHAVEVAATGAEAIARARLFRPDVVLCDIGLPGMDGYEVAQAMRADPELRDAVLVALTGYAAPEDMARTRRAGFDMHVAKPPSLEKLEEALAARRTSTSGGTR